MGKIASHGFFGFSIFPDLNLNRTSSGETPLRAESSLVSLNPKGPQENIESGTNSLGSTKENSSCR